MSYGLRSIAFVAELIHPPLKHDPRALQKLHGELFSHGACSYRDFRQVPGGAILSNTSTGMPGSPVSSTHLLADRIQIREEQTGQSREDFQERVQTLASKALEALPLKVFMAQQFAVRSVINPHLTQDAKDFMLRTVFGFDESLVAGFGTPPTLAGLRMAFPPDPQVGGIFNVRIESFTLDNRSLFLENVGTFGTPVGLDALDSLATRFDATYNFVQEQLIGFVSQFDGDGDGDGGE